MDICVRERLPNLEVSFRKWYFDFIKPTLSQWQGQSLTQPICTNALLDPIRPNYHWEPWTNIWKIGNTVSLRLVLTNR